MTLPPVKHRKTPPRPHPARFHFFKNLRPSAGNSRRSGAAGSSGPIPGGLVGKFPIPFQREHAAAPQSQTPPKGVGNPTPIARTAPHETALAALEKDPSEQKMNGEHAWTSHVARS